MAYKKVVVPQAGEKIELKDGKLYVPDNPIVPFIEGDGTGPDIWRASSAVLDAAVAKAYGGKKKIAWYEVYAGEKAKNLFDNWLPDETVEAFRQYLVGIKGPLTTPVGGGIRSLNVALRQLLDLYVCLRPVRYFRGVPSPVKRPEKVDMVIFRENTEDIYAGIEYAGGTAESQKILDFLAKEFPKEFKKIRFGTATATDAWQKQLEGVGGPARTMGIDVGIGIKPVSYLGTERLVHSALSYAVKHKRKSVTFVHKGNIMKFTEGAFMKWGYALAEKEFGDKVYTWATWEKTKEEKGEEDEGLSRRPYSSNFAKLSYQKLFYQSHNRMVDNRRVEDNQIAVMRIATDGQLSALQAFYSAREIHETGICRFKAHHCSEEPARKTPRPRGYSIDTDITGAYYLNNWISNEGYFCEKPPPEERTANLVYDLLKHRWDRALEAVTAMPRAPHSAALEYILTGFKAVAALLPEEERQLRDHFMGRPTHEVLLMKMSSESVGGTGGFINVFEEDQRTRFHDIRSLPRKVEILRVNLEYLVKFAGAYRPAVKDGYLQLVFKLLGNACDQEGGIVPADQDYLQLLLQLDLRLSDRLNFAAKLLGERRRREFCEKLE